MLLPILWLSKRTEDDGFNQTSLEVGVECYAGHRGEESYGRNWVMAL